MDSIAQRLQLLENELANSLDLITNSIGDDLSSYVMGINYLLTQINNKFNLSLTQLNSSISNIRTDMNNNFTSVINVIQTQTQLMQEFFINLFSVEYDESINSEYNLELGKVQQKFAFIENVKTAGTTVINKLTASSSAPSITIHLDNSSNLFSSLNGKTVTVSMSFWEPYKPIADKVISAFLWGFYIWLLLKRAPDIINGAGMITDYTDRFSEHGSGKTRVQIMKERAKK